MTLPYAQCVRGDRETDALVLILAGGTGRRLGPLTQNKPKPALNVAGKFRSIDFTLSNCLNSGQRRISVLTQYRSRELGAHLASAWQFLHSQLGEFIEHWPAASGDSSAGYGGTADAVRQNLALIKDLNPELTLILAGDHVYKMDYRPMLAAHARRKADLTVSTVRVPIEDARQFGVACRDETHRITHFQEKPDAPCIVPGEPQYALASMGVYLFRTDALIEALEYPGQLDRTPLDFGRDVLPGLVQKNRVFAHEFIDSAGEPGFWRDIGTVDALWETNMAARCSGSGLVLHDENWPIWTAEPQLPSAQIESDRAGNGASVEGSIVSNGCHIVGSRVESSVLSYDVRIATGSTVSESVVMPHARVGANCGLERCIVGEGACVPDGLVVGQDRRLDAKRFTVSPKGIVLITSEDLKRLSTNQGMSEAHDSARNTLHADDRILTTEPATA